MGMVYYYRPTCCNVGWLTGPGVDVVINDVQVYLRGVWAEQRSILFYFWTSIVVPKLDNQGKLAIPKADQSKCFIRLEDIFRVVNNYLGKCQKDIEKQKLFWLLFKCPVTATHIILKISDNRLAY